MDSKKAQSSIEYIVLLSALLAAVVIFFVQANQQVSSNIRDSAALAAVEKIAATASEVSHLGPGTKLYVWVDIPPNVQESYVGNKTVGLTMYIPEARSSTDVEKYVGASVEGTIPTSPGPHKIAVEMLDSGTVIIG